MGRGLGWVTHRGPFQPRPFCDSVILQWGKFSAVPGVDTRAGLGREVPLLSQNSQTSLAQASRASLPPGGQRAVGAGTVPGTYLLRKVGIRLRSCMEPHGLRALPQWWPEPLRGFALTSKEKRIYCSHGRDKDKCSHASSALQHRCDKHQRKTRGCICFLFTALATNMVWDHTEWQKEKRVIRLLSSVPRLSLLLPALLLTMSSASGITESRTGLGWKGPCGPSGSNPPALGRDPFHQPSVLQAPSSRALSTAREGAATASLGNLGQGLTTLMGKNFFLISNLNLPLFQLKPLPLVMPSCSPHRHPLPAG